MSYKQPITIKRGTFVCTLYDVSNLMELPLANLRKLWKLMFSEEWENRETIQTIRDWLPVNIKETEQSARALQAALEQKAALATAQRQLKVAEKAVKTAKAARVKAQKLQIIFNEMSKN